MKPAAVVRITRRTAVAGAGALGVTALLARGAPTDAVSLPTLRRNGDVDDTAAFRRAAALGRPIHAPASGGSGPGGRYVVGYDKGAELPSGFSLYGDGIGKTVIRRARRSPFIFFCDSGSADPARNVTGLRFADLTLESEVEALGFSEFEYLVMLNGVTDARFDRVGFVGFRGDGLHLGSSPTPATERHNRSVQVSHCLFDGINANNRNAISIVDVDGMTIENSSFLRCTRVGDGTVLAGDPFKPATGLAMPGPIDIEPNADRFTVVRDVVIRGNRFSGGGGYAVALHPLPNSFVGQAQRGIQVSGNIIEDRIGGIDMTGYPGDTAMGDGPAYDIQVFENVVRRCTTPFRISGIKGLRLTRNQFLDCRDRAELNNNAAVADVELRENRFELIGSDAAPYGLWMRSCDRTTLIGNSFVDCGGPGRRDGTAIAFVEGTPRRLTLSDNRFSSPLGRMANAAQRFRDAKIDPRQITLDDNRSSLTGASLASVLLSR